jgi:hypothetical protein
MEVGEHSFPSAIPFSDLLSQGLLDFSRDFDVSLMDKIVMTFYTGAGQEVCISLHQMPPFTNGQVPQQQLAQQVLTQFKEHPDAWTRVPDILEKSSFPQTKVIYFDSIHHVTGIGWLSNFDLVHRAPNPRNFDLDALEVIAGGTAARSFQSFSF